MKIPERISHIMDELLTKCQSGDWYYDDSKDPDSLILPWNIPPVAGQFLYDLVLEKRPQHILEMGTSTGYSALWLGAAAQNYGGHINTVDYFDRKIPIATKNISDAGLNDTITIHHGRIIPLMEATPDNYYGFVFMDADKSNYHHYLPHLLRIMTPDGIIVADNAINFASHMTDFVELCKNNKELTVELLDVGNGLLVVRRN
jgi:predicted O-methyltransferase YrrM